MKIMPNQVKEGCKRGPTGPTRMIQGKIRRPKRCTKRSIQEPMEPARHRAPCPGHGGRIPRWLLRFLATFYFPTRFFGFCSCFVYKKRMNMVGKGSRFHSLETLKLTQSPLMEKEKKKQQRHRVWMRVERSSI